MITKHALSQKGQMQTAAPHGMSSAHITKRHAGGGASTSAKARLVERGPVSYGFEGVRDTGNVTFLVSDFAFPLSSWYEYL